MIMKLLHLVLKKQWYDMIEFGEKKEEYREIKPYWMRIFTLCYSKGFTDCKYRRCSRPGCLFPKHFDAICFHRGYTSTTMLFELKKITIGRGRKEWGAPDHETFILKLGEKLK